MSLVERDCMIAQTQQNPAEVGKLNSPEAPDVKTDLIRINDLASKASPVQTASPGAVPDLSSSSEPEVLAGNGLADDPELIAEFVAEAREHLSSIEANLLMLEKEHFKAGGMPETVHSVFRCFHTIKGLAGFLSLGPIQAVAHETETLLDQARERRISIGPSLIDATLKAADYVRVALDALSSKPPQEAMAGLPSNEALLQEIAAASAQRPLTAVEIAPDMAPEVALSAGESAAPLVAKRSDASTVRVDTAKLEYLVEMVGELVIAQSLIHFSPGNAEGAPVGLSRNFAQLGRVTGEIQKTAMSMRMVPISRLYDKMARLIRDLARKSGKRIELRRIGDQVELDRNIVEEITDPVVHMIRNSVDHGIEDTEERAASGKGETAYITLEAFHQAGYVNLRMSDDGRGLSADKIRLKALQKGLIAADTKQDEQSLFKLIFEPGFSTAERITNISGRGVGMDVVRRQIEKLRGTIQIDSRLGRGCAFTLKVPLTLAMVDGLILESGAERYILPVYSVREMFHVTADKLFTVENRSELVLLRGSLLPVVRLDCFLGRARQDDGSNEIGIVVEGRSRHFCLIVDRLLGKQEVVIKTLGTCFKNVTGVAGGAILGDGRVGLILDVHGIGGGDDGEA